MRKSLKNRSTMTKDTAEFSFFPGCSLKASGHENTLSLLKFCEKVGIKLTELTDWNCCGSSSAHSVDPGVAIDLPMRNLSLAPKGKPLLIACPSCLLRLKSTWVEMRHDQTLRKAYEKKWGVAYDESLEIIHFFEIFDRIQLDDYIDNPKDSLKQLKVAPYYGCMLSMPPILRHEINHEGIMEKTLSKLGADMVSYGYARQCCGTYLSAAKPKIAEKVVNQIVSKAMEAGAECLVTACSMCHLNLEIRCTVEHPIPVLHFSELLSMALGEGDQKKWFPRHIVDPVPLLKQRKLLL